MFQSPSLGASKPDALQKAQAVFVARYHLKEGISTYAACAMAAAALCQKHGLHVQPETVSDWLMEDLSRSSQRRTPNWDD